MMELLAVCAAALFASLLTLFSGFGLGTLLMPVIALFFPVELAVAMTAVVHLANNAFKLVLLGRQASAQVLLQFGVPALFASGIGAAVLVWLSHAPAVVRYAIGNHAVEVPLIQLTLGVLILLFVLLEISPRFSALAFSPRLLPLGGVLSGFFGGLSGHQGALRSLFLVKSGLDAQTFVATSAVLAVMVDVARMLVYGAEFISGRADIDWTLVGFACLSAFAGAWLGARLLGKVTLDWVQRLVTLMLLLVGAGMVTGLL